MDKLIWIGIIGIFLINSCSDPNADTIEENTTKVAANFQELKTSLDNKTLKNAVLLQSYTDQLKAKKPEYSELLDTIATQATSGGDSIKKLQERINKSKQDFDDSKMGSGDYVIELENLIIATDKEIYDASLIDEINTVAALSEGELSHVDLPENETVKAGENLVGNPTYGHWQNRNGYSFWTWYGQYAFFRTMFGEPRYSNWYYDRPWSYNYDIYHNRYGSHGWKFNENQTFNSNYKDVNDKGKASGRKASMERFIS